MPEGPSLTRAQLAALPREREVEALRVAADKEGRGVLLKALHRDGTITRMLVPPASARGIRNAINESLAALAPPAVPSAGMATCPEITGADWADALSATEILPVRFETRPFTSAVFLAALRLDRSWEILRLPLPIAVYLTSEVTAAERSGALSGWTSDPSRPSFQN